jgi:hypothetical protein
MMMPSRRDRCITKQGVFRSCGSGVRTMAEPIVSG